MEERLSRKLAVILHADVVGSTMLVQRNELLAHARIQDAFRRFSLTIEAYSGVTHELRGDALVAEFARASDAVAAGLAFQRENTESNARLEDDLRPQLRIGISLGEVVIADNTVTGVGVVLAQRLEQLAEAGGVCIQGAAYETVPKRLQFEYHSLGERDVKGFEEPVRAYRVSLKPGEVIPPPEPHAVPVEAQLERPKRQWIAIGAIALLIIVGGGLAWLQPWQPREEPASIERMAFPLPEKPSIAVLPFDNLSGDASQDYLADGMTEDIISHVSQIERLFVIARNSTFVYKNRPVKVQEVAEELGVRYVLEGSVQKAGERLRITAQLIDALTGRHMWSERFDRDETDLFILQDEIADRIVVALQVELTEGEQIRVWRGHSPNLDAWRQVAKGDELFHRFNRAANAQAREAFTRAIEIDRTYALAHALLAWTYWLDAQRGWQDRATSFRRATVLAREALALDDTLPDVHALMGAIYLYQGKYEEALASAQKAVELNPNHATNTALLGMIQHNAGRPKEAIRTLKRAMRLSPYHETWFLAELAYAYRSTGQTDNALEAWRAFLARSPDPMPAAHGHINIALILESLGKTGEARAEVARALELDPSISISGLAKQGLDRERAHHASVETLRSLGVPE